MSRVAPEAAERIAVVGAGTIGASWTAFFLAQGKQVTVSDPAPDAAEIVGAFVARVWPTLERLGVAPGAEPTGFEFHADPAQAVRGAQFVQESAPENLAVKQELFARLEEALPAEAVVASSSSGLLISEIQAGRLGPERYVIGHPFNPPHLVPLVEVVGGRQTDAAAVDWALAFYRALGKRAIRINKEVPGHLANRLQAALWREAVNAVAAGVASVEDVDAAVAFGPGLRWALMGPHMTFHLGGGEGGMRHFIDHLGPAIEGWWADLGDAKLTPEVADQLVAGVDVEAAGRSIGDLARQRDALLVALLDTLARTRAELGQ